MLTMLVSQEQWVSRILTNKSYNVHIKFSASGTFRTFVSNQVELSLLRMLPDLDGCIASSAELNLLPTGGWVVSRVSTLDNPPPDNRKFGTVPIKEVEALLEKMRTIGGHHGKSVSQVALNWCMSKGAIPIPGAKNAKQAEENAGALGWRLTKEEVEALDQLGYPAKTTWFQSDFSRPLPRMFLP